MHPFRIALALYCISAGLTLLVEATENAERPWVSVKDFGASGECRVVADARMNRGEAILYSGLAHFTPADVGKPVTVLGASSKEFPELGEVSGAPLESRIAAVLDGSTAKLEAAAAENVTNARACWGADDSEAIQKAIDSLAETGGTVYLPPGKYRVTYHGGPGVKIAHSNIRLTGNGPSSAIFNSTVIFRAKKSNGRIVTEEGGGPVLYAGSAPNEAPIENVEVDHLWLGDNGQNYDFRVWGPHGPGVLGAAGAINRVHFHDLTIETDFLCGLNMNSVTDGFEFDHLTVLCSGEHGFYLAGTGSHGEVHDNRVLGTTKPMRQGIAIKKKTNIRVTNNEVAHVDFQGIGVEGDSPDYTNRDVLIADNWLHDLETWHTEGITLFNCEDVIVRNNRLENISWIAISLRTPFYPVSRVAIKDNYIVRAGQMNPCFAIQARFDPPKDASKGQGHIDGITIAGNTIVDSPRGISVGNLSGKNVVRNNRVETHYIEPDALSYEIKNPAEGGTIKFEDNESLNCPERTIGEKVECGNFRCWSTGGAKIRDAK